MRTPEQFARAYAEAVNLSIQHNKDFWVVPMDKDPGYAVSSFEPTSGLPGGTKPLRVTPEKAAEEKARRGESGLVRR